MSTIGEGQGGLKSNTIAAKLSTQGRVYGLGSERTLVPMKAAELEGRLTGFRRGQPTVVSVRFREEGLTRYHLYSGGENFVPTESSDVGGSRKELILEMQVLDRDKFLADLPPVSFENRNSVPWMAEHVALERVLVHGDHVRLCFRQNPPIEDYASFEVQGITAKEVRSRVGKTSLDFELTDFVHTKKVLRIYHDGSGRASGGFCHGSRFDCISCLGWDGTRLRIGYREKPRETLTCTLYFANPGDLYNVESAEVSSPVAFRGALKVDGTYSVSTRRGMEDNMINVGSAYDHGRIGAEIAFSIAMQQLGIRNLSLADPSSKGSDLESREPSVFMEARMLVRTRSMKMGSQIEEVSRHLAQMRAKLRRTISWARAPSRGIAILTYQDADSTLRSLVVEVKRE